jgi:hypothetical protein
MTYSVAEVESQRRVNDDLCSDRHAESLALASHWDSWCSFAVALPFVCEKAFLGFFSRGETSNDTLNSRSHLLG